MIDLFKNWINTLLMLGIFVIILQLIIPNTNLKKYINSLVGLLVIVTILSPIYDVFKNGGFNENLELVISNIDEFTKQDQKNSDAQDNIQSELIISSMKDKIKENISQKFITQGIQVESVKTEISKDYEVISISIYFEKNIMSTKKDKINRVVDSIKEEYDIDYSNISIVEEGI